MCPDIWPRSCPLAASEGSQHTTHYTFSPHYFYPSPPHPPFSSASSPRTYSLPLLPSRHFPFTSSPSHLPSPFSSPVPLNCLYYHQFPLTFISFSFLFPSLPHRSLIISLYSTLTYLSSYSHFSFFLSLYSLPTFFFASLVPFVTLLIALP